MKKSPNTQDTGTLLACRRSRSTTEKVFQILNVRSAEQTSADQSKLSSGASALPLPRKRSPPLSPSLHHHHHRKTCSKTLPGPRSYLNQRAQSSPILFALELRAGPVRLRENRSPAAFRRRASPHPPAAPVLLCNP